MVEDRAQWRPISQVPLNRDVEVWVTDGVDEYRFSTQCRRTEDGWIYSKFKSPVPARFKLLAWRESE